MTVVADQNRGIPGFVWIISSLILGFAVLTALKERYFTSLLFVAVALSYVVRLWPGREDNDTNRLIAQAIAAAVLITWVAKFLLIL